MPDATLILLAAGVLASLLLPWILLMRIKGMQRELDELHARLGGLEDKTLFRKAEPEPAKAPPTTPATEAVPPPAPPPLPVAAQRTPAAPPAERAFETPVATAPQAPLQATEESSTPPNFWEETTENSTRHGEANPDWFGKVAIWVGGVALLMASFYLIRFSMESGWLTPLVRLVATTVFGLALCGGGVFFSGRFRENVNVRVGQALSGAGIGTLYFSAYAAVHLYGFLGTGGGFIGMAAITVLAVALSLRHGAPIALMGLAGGFLTPFLMAGETPDTRLLFTYLFFLYVGASVLCARRQWPALALFSLIACFAWSIFVIVGIAGGLATPAAHVPIFILAIAVFTVASRVVSPADPDAPLDPNQTALTAASIATVLGVGLGQLFVLSWIRGFAGIETGTFAVLALGAWALAVIRDREFAWTAWLALGAVAILTALNFRAPPLPFFAWPGSLVLLFFVTAHWMSTLPLSLPIWYRVTLGILPAFFVLAYVNRLFISPPPGLPDSLWLGLAIVSALALTAAAEHLRLWKKRDAPSAARLHLAAWGTAALGLWVYLPSTGWIWAAIGLLLASTLYWRARGLALAPLAALGFGAVWMLTVLSAAKNTLIYTLALGDPLTWSLSPNLAASLFASAGALFALPRLAGPAVAHATISRVAAASALGIAVVVTYALLEQSWLVPNGVTPAVIAGGLTALLALASVLAAWCLRTEKHANIVTWSLAGIVGWRILRLHLFGDGGAGDGVFLNALLLQLGVPLAAALGVIAIARKRTWLQLLGSFQVIAMVLAFLYATFSARAFFGAERLFDPFAGSADLYTLSLVWLALAILWQSLGLWRRSSVLHIGSLILLLVTVGKVFFIDAANLTGLPRVLSFLVLGSALIGIGFFYNKVVFARKPAQPDPSKASTEPS